MVEYGYTRQHGLVPSPHFLWLIAMTKEGCTSLCEPSIVVSVSGWSVSFFRFGPRHTFGQRWRLSKRRERRQVLRYACEFASQYFVTFC